MALSGSDRRVVRLTGGDRLKPRRVQVGGALVLPNLQLSGEISPLVEVGGALSLGALALSGGVTPEVEVTGELLLPSLHLSGGVSPRVEVGGSLELPNLALSGEITPWTPAQVPEVAAGRWWDPEHHTDLGSTSFRLLEQNAQSPWDGLQANTDRQPTIITGNGYSQFRYGGSSGGNDVCNTATLTGIAMGWTGPTWIGVWNRMPSGVTGSNRIFRHGPAAGTRRLLQGYSTATNSVNCVVSNDGTNQLTYTWNSGIVFTDWNFTEYRWVPSEPAANRLQFWLNRVYKAPAVSGAPTSTVLADPVSSLLTFAGSASSVSNTDDTDIGMFYYANGIPEEPVIDQLYRYKSPIIIP